jgi:hypothetical protein
MWLAACMHLQASIMTTVVFHSSAKLQTAFQLLIADKLGQLCRSETRSLRQRMPSGTCRRDCLPWMLGRWPKMRTVDFVSVNSHPIPAQQIPALSTGANWAFVHWRRCGTAWTAELQYNTQTSRTSQSGMYRTVPGNTDDGWRVLSVSCHHH